MNVISKEIDWTYDFSAHGRDRDGVMDPFAIHERVKLLQQCESGIGIVDATDDGGWPRMWWGRVLAVGMVSMWPWNKPRPSVGVGALGGLIWLDWTQIADVRAGT